ncbi:MAG: hypothetical protein NUV97_00895 [archaeon]|nr:hypothetical protein [archaeon]MCR4323482.1 hypothetical protein [Nanoarchaeota archaeon]
MIENTQGVGDLNEGPFSLEEPFLLDGLYESTGPGLERFGYQGGHFSRRIVSSRTKYRIERGGRLISVGEETERFQLVKVYRLPGDENPRVIYHRPIGHFLIGSSGPLVEVDGR